METKESILNLLDSLGKMGLDRRAIEKDLDYGEFYIDQIVSRGGNPTFLKRLEKYNMEKNTPAGNLVNNVTKTGEASEELSAVKEQLFTLQASVNVLLTTVSSISAVQKGKEFASVFGELRQAIKDETRNLLSQYSKEQH